jgi:predicted TPR repeat methyltransferase
MSGLRRTLDRVRDKLFYAVPPSLRDRVAAALPSRVAPPLTQSGSFTHLFDSGDPYGFDTSPNERLKYRRTLELCGDGDLGRVLEIGCAVGSFTEVLAPRASELLGIDVAPGAVQRARQRLAGQPHVRLETRTIPAEFPDETFDLIVASDVLYYLSVRDLRASVTLIDEALDEGGALIVVHYLPPVGVLAGDEVHDILREHTTLAHVHEERTEFGAGRSYRIDRFEKRR